MASVPTYTCSDYKHFKEILLATGSELHKVTILLLGRLSVEHGDSTSKETNLALPQVLSNAPVELQKMKSLDYEGNRLKIYDVCGTIKLSIDLTEIDIPLAIDFLRKIDGLLPQLERKCTYRPRNHPTCCIKEHHTPTSYKVDAIGHCSHCRIDEAICRLDYFLEMDRKLRNIGGHLIETIGVNFLDGRHIFPELPNCANVDQLFNLIETTMNGLLDFMAQVKYFPILKALDSKKVLEHEVLLNKIFESNQNELEKYFLSDILKSQNFHKEHSTRKLNLQILIERTDLPWYSIYSWFPNLTTMFKAKDITLKGPLMKVFRNSIVDVFENKMNLKYKQDYNITDLHCFFHKYSKNVANLSYFDFHICVSERAAKPFPAYLSDGMSEETVDLTNHLEKNISDDVFNEYNMKVEVGFNRWGFGSIKIGGYISVLNGKFTQTVKMGILIIIKHQTEIHFDTPFVVIKELISYELDETKLDLSFRLTSTVENVYFKIEKNKKLIKEWFLDNVNKELAKDQKEKDTGENKDPGNVVSRKLQKDMEMPIPGFSNLGIKTGAKSKRRSKKIIGNLRRRDSPPQSSPKKKTVDIDDSDDYCDSYDDPEEEYATLETSSWYHGKVDRATVSRLLKHDGDFIVREKSDGSGDKVLSVLWNSVTKHIILKPDTEGMFKLESELFSNIPDLINHHHNKTQVIQASSGVVLIKPINRLFIEGDGYVTKREEVKLDTKLGAGHFGEVWRGVLLTRNLPVAVKTCKPKDDVANQRQKFLEEAQIMRDCKHPNVVKFIGVCKQEDPYYIILELCEKGDLLQVLRKESVRLTLQHFMQMAIDVAYGMEFLERKQIIHRDLAARNCLVKMDYTVKICDFGMSREEDDNGIYSISETKEIPFKWVAPEVWHYNQYSSKTDVWSFGVVLWEIFSQGQQPYTGWSNKDAKLQIDNGYRLPSPPGTPSNIYNIMAQCWQQDPAQRQHFSQLCSQLREVKEKLKL